MTTQTKARVLTMVISVLMAALALGAVLGSLPRARALPQFQTWVWPGANCVTTLQACIDQAADYDTISIATGTYTTSVTVNKSITLTSSTPTTTLYALAGQRVMTISALAPNPPPQVMLENLVLRDGNLSVLTGCGSSCNGGGLLVTDKARVRLVQVALVYNQAVQGGGLYINTGSVALISGTIYSNHATQQSPTVGNSGGGVYVADQQASFQLDGGEVAFNTAVDGAGIFVQDGKYIQNGGLVLKNTAQNWGGGLLVANSSAGAQLNGGRIISNSATDGGGVLVDAGQLRINNATIVGNDASIDIGRGGGVAVLKPTALVLQAAGGVVSDNQAKLGGGYYITGGVVSLGPTIRVLRNHASESGGGLYVQGGGAVTQSGGEISGNFANLNGGGVLVSGGQFILTDGDILDNQATAATSLGGGVQVDGGGVFLGWGGRVISNATPFGGGGVGLWSGSVTISGTDVVGNHAPQGGGFYVVSGTLKLQGGRVTANTALQGNGGGLYLAGVDGRLEQTGGNVIGNHAPASIGNGGGLYIEQGLAKITGGQYVGNNAGLNGGGIASLDGVLFMGGAAQVVQNQASIGNGGGVAVLAGTATLANGVLISGNVAGTGSGGGLYAVAPLTVTGVRFINNVINNPTNGSGGGLYLSGSADARIANSLFARNTGLNGAGLALNSSGRATLMYLTVAGDIIPQSGAAIKIASGTVGVTDTIVTSYTTSLLANAGVTLTADYNLFYGTAVPVSGTHDLIGLDPQFIDPAHDNYRLPIGSPAVNTGLDIGVYSDLGGWPRPIGSGFDRGAFEVQALGLPITPSVGATLLYTSNTGTTTTLTLPPTLVTTATSVIFTNLVELPVDAPPPTQYQFAGSVFEIDAFGPAGAIAGLTFTQPVTIVIHYSDADVAGISEAWLRLYRFEHPPFGNGWCAIGDCRPLESQTLDLANNVITATVLGFSKWGQMGLENAYEIFLPVALKGN